MAIGHGGVFVVQPPYLLFYADRDQRRRAGWRPPDVLLKGFAMEDVNAFANSLTSGPDGWLYGAQGARRRPTFAALGFSKACGG